MPVKMKNSHLVSAAIVLVIIGVWVFLLSTNDEHPEMMPPLSGCYLPSNQSRKQMINVIASGHIQYGSRITGVVPYVDKTGLALLPRTKMVVGVDGQVGFAPGYPLLLRVDQDSRGFVVPSEVASFVSYRKVECRT